MCSAREKIALLIGNQRYDSAPLNKLKHTEEEVGKVAEKLRKLNFKVHCTISSVLYVHACTCTMYV